MLFFVFVAAVEVVAEGGGSYSGTLAVGARMAAA
jgi:hypothetical protein